MTRHTNVLSLVGNQTTRVAEASGVSAHSEWLTATRAGGDASSGRCPAPLGQCFLNCWASRRKSGHVHSLNFSSSHFTPTRPHQGTCPGTRVPASPITALVRKRKPTNHRMDEQRGRPRSGAAGSDQNKRALATQDEDTLHTCDVEREKQNTKAYRLMSPPTETSKQARLLLGMRCRGGVTLGRREGQGPEGTAAQMLLLSWSGSFTEGELVNSSLYTGGCVLFLYVFRTSI